MVSFRTKWNYIGNWLSEWLAAGDSSPHDEHMTANRALTYPPVWHCVSKISGAFMIMELELLRAMESGREVQDSHPANMLVQWRPNSYQTPSQWKRQMLCHALLWGNARSYILRDENRRPVELIPLMPDRTVTVMHEGEKWHATLINRDDRLGLGQDMAENQEKTIYMRDEDVWHVPGLGFDGVVGQSLISVAKQSWGIGIGAQTHVAQQQKKGYAGGLALEVPANTQQLRDAGAAREFLKDFREQHEGAVNAGKVMLLREGIKANVIAMNNTDAQFIEQRRFQREDTALLFMLEGILGDSSNASFASLQQRNLAYRINCLSPWTVAIEEESNVKLLNASERRRGYYFKFDDRSLLRMDSTSLMSFCSQAITARVLNPNECRELLDYNPYDGGDQYLNPAIDKQSGGASNQPKQPEPPPADRARQARLSHLIGVEAGKVESAAQQAATKGRNFLQWLDDFYDKKWVGKLADCLEEIGIDREEASVHCVESKRRLLEVCDYSQPDNLVENVAKCVSNWKNRASNIGVLHV